MEKPGLFERWIIEYGSIQICKFIQLFLPKNLFSNISSLYVVCNIFQVNCVFTSLNTIKIKTSIKASVAERKLFNFSPGPSFVPCFGLHPGSDSGCSGQKKRHSSLNICLLTFDIWQICLQGGSCWNRAECLPAYHGCQLFRNSPAHQAHGRSKYTVHS